MADLPLAGRRVAVTRPREQAEPLAAELERLGATAAVVPLIAIEPAEGAERGEQLVLQGGHDWIVLTSANAVRAVADALRRSERARVAAVGPATAEALRALGLEPAFVPERFAASELAAGLGELAGTRVLLPRSEIADPRLATELAAGGALVDVVDVYRTVARAPSGDELEALATAHAILLGSGSAARSLASLGLSLERALVVCIGESTADAARTAGLRVDLVAEEATEQGMIQALVSHFRGSG